MAKTIPTAEQMGSGWTTGMSSGATHDKVTRGVNAVTEAPGLAAAAQVDFWSRRLAEQRTKDKWSRKVGAVPLSRWKTLMSTLGIERMSTSATAKQSKYVEAMRLVRPVLEQVTATTRSMPKDSLEQRIARATYQMRAMAGGGTPGGTPA